MSANKLYGYRHGVKEPSIETNIRFVIPNIKNFDELDKIIVAIFYEPKNLSRYINHNLNTLSEEYLLRLTIVISYLLRSSGIPTFEIGKVLEIKKYHSDYNVSAKLCIPYLDFLPLNFLKLIIISAQNLLKTISQDLENSSVNLEKYWGSINTQIIQPAKKEINSGVSTLPILNAASAQGIPFRHLGEGIYQIGIGKELRLISKSAVDYDSSIGASISSRKNSTTRILKLAGLPTPIHQIVHSLDDAYLAAKKISYPVVIKPADRERSEGVSVNIFRPEQVPSAYNISRKFSRNILVEKQVSGTCYRLMIANGKFLYAVKRLPRLLIGDGRSTIKQLFDFSQTENLLLPPWLRKKEIKLDEGILEHIKSQGYTINDIPSNGVYIYLKSIESTEWGETTFDVTDTVSIENVALAEKAARVLGLQNAGVDIITTDISQPVNKIGGVINEINYRPHFGGTLAAKAKMGQYVKDLVTNGGVIPIEVYMGDDLALEYAKKRQQILLKKRVNAFIVDHTGIWSTTKKIEYLNLSIFELTQILMMDKSTEAIIMTVRTDELLHSGLPFHSINKLKVLNKNINLTRPNDKFIDSLKIISQLESLFESYLIK